MVSRKGMQKFLPFAIIGVVVVGALGAGWYFMSSQSTEPYVQVPSTPNSNPEAVGMQSEPQAKGEAVLFNVHGWATQLPRDLFYCGDTEGFPFALSKLSDGPNSDAGGFLLATWRYRKSPNDGYTCGASFQECKAFLTKGGTVQDKIANEIKGFEVTKGNERSFFAEVSKERGVLQIRQKGRGERANAIYDQILNTLLLGERYQFDVKALEQFPTCTDDL